MGNGLFLGLDIGSSTVKALALDGQLSVVAQGLCLAGYGGQEAARSLVDSILEQNHRNRADLSYTVVTGYGRVRYQEADQEVSEITCHATGAFHLCPRVRTVVDIGGQDSKAIRLDEQGRLLDFVMNDKCAAGTGKFLEVMAGMLSVSMEDLGPLAMRSSHPVSISSTCTVFAESEAISHMSRGAAAQDVAAGLHKAIAQRIWGLLVRIGVAPQLMLTGGVALNVGLVSSLEGCSETPILVPANPQLVGALGAALYAAKKGRR